MTAAATVGVGVAAKGRPRDAALDRAVLDATVELLATTRYADLTVSAIARRAGVGKPSVYLRWRTKAAIVVDAVADAMSTAPFPDRGSLRADLTAGLGEMIRRFNTTVVGTALPGLLGDLRGDAELAATFRRRYFEPRWESVRAAVARAAVRGEVDGGIDVDLLIDVLTGPIYYRLLVRDRPLRPADARRLVAVGLAAAAGGAFGGDGGPKRAR